MTRASSEVSNTGIGEFGKTPLRLAEGSAIFGDLPAEQTAWMSHRDSVLRPPSGFAVTASTETTPVAAMEHRERALYGVQFHPEVGHTPRGTEMLGSFVLDVCQAPPTWTACLTWSRWPKRFCGCIRPLPASIAPPARDSAG